MQTSKSKQVQQIGSRYSCFLPLDGQDYKIYKTIQPLQNVCKQGRAHTEVWRHSQDSHERSDRGFDHLVNGPQAIFTNELQACSHEFHISRQILWYFWIIGIVTQFFRNRWSNCDVTYLCNSIIVRSSSKNHSCKKETKGLRILYIL